MKTTTLTATGIYSLSTIAAFICTYFFNLAMANSDQYLALVGVVMADGFFGVRWLLWRNCWSKTRRFSNL